MSTQQVKFEIGGIRLPVTLIYADDGRIYLKFQYNKSLIAEVKTMEGRTWHPAPKKAWSIPDTPRNRFHMEFLMGGNPYEHWESPLKNFTYERPLRDHQKEFADFMLTRHYCVLAGEMGCISGDAIVHVNRAGKGLKIPLKRLHYCFNGGTTRGRMWDERIPTYIRSLKGDTLGLNLVIKTLYQGIKDTVRLVLKSGKSVILTPDHKVCVGIDTYKEVRHLTPGDTVLSNGRWTDKDGYIRVGGLKGQHPRWTTGGVYEHILVVEEELGDFLPLDQVVHHKNGIRHDNRIENLEMMSIAEHAALHGNEHSFKNLSGGTSYNGGEIHFVPCFDTVVSIESAGKQDVYDIVCDDPYRNFVADGVVVHNCGKTLAAIEVMERSGLQNWWYVAPKSALMSVQLEFKKWKMPWRPRTMTYEGLTKTIKEWHAGRRAPFGVFFDESARVKNPTSQRSQAAKHLADAIREEYGMDGFVILMSGAPAPKSPVDWWHQCEIACPGFLREGHVASFKQRLAVIVQKESITGGAYPHIVTWRDDEKKCDKCGQYRKEHQPSIDDDGEFTCTDYTPSVNEVARLGRCMSGLVLKKLKSDCLDLPEKQYRQIHVEPTRKILNLAQGIVDRARNTITAITQLRMLSDGFMYKQEKTGEKVCPACHGNEEERPTINDQPYCGVCHNEGIIESFKRIAYQVECPKEQVIIDLLDEHIEVGRIGFYAGFTGSIERLVEICKKGGWDTIKADGHGWKTSFDGDPLDVFQNGQDSKQRVAFIGQPGAAGTGLTLTASPTGVYYSNDFDADHRIQSEDRFHRLGMDINRGCMIIDIFHLPTDELVYNNLKAKRQMQSMTLDEIKAVLS